MNGKIHLLVVEDDVRLADGLRRNLELEEFSVDYAATGEDALKQITDRKAPLHMVILDIMLPGIDGLEVCRRLRDAGNTVPILFLTAKGSDADRILGLQTGADDYLPKPFVFEELVLRVRGILRRAEWSGAKRGTDTVITIGSCRVHLEQLQVQTVDGPVSLTEREALLLRFFSENEGRVITRGELLERVWGYSFDTATRTLDTFVHRLRKRFEQDPRRPCHFHTVRGVGYRFTAEPEA